MSGTRRRGFALLVVLWTLATAAALLLLLTTASREASGAAEYRLQVTRTRWVAEGCAVAVHAAIAQRMAQAGDADHWMSIDSALALPAEITRCTVRLEPAGLRPDVNRVSDAQLRDVVHASGVGGARADTITDAILDWRDADDEPRPAGAESPWYRAHGHQPPRNGPFANPEELGLVRAAGSLAGIDSLFGTDGDRLLLGRAPMAALGGMPGMSPEAAMRLRQLRTTSRRPLTVSLLIGGLSPDAAGLMAASMAALTASVTDVPDTWIITSVASSGHPPVTARVELRIGRAGRRAVVLRRRVSA